MGQILEFPIEMAGHPYNSAALPRSLWLDRSPVSNWRRVSNKSWSAREKYIKLVTI